MSKLRLLPILLLTTLCLTSCVGAGGSDIFAAIGSTQPAAEQSNPAKAICGQVREWSPEYQAELAAALEPLPRDSPLWQAFRDAVAARKAVRICRGEP